MPKNLLDCILSIKIKKDIRENFLFNTFLVPKRRNPSITELPPDAQVDDVNYDDSS